MPMMMLMLTSEGSNFSSANYDNSLWSRRIASEQTKITAKDLRPMAEIIKTEMVLNSRGGLVAPREYFFNFVWPALDHPDPWKAYKPVSQALKDGTISATEVIKRDNRDAETVFGMIEKERESGQGPERKKEEKQQPKKQEKAVTNA
jgi:hypothetical protein